MSWVQGSRDKHALPERGTEAIIVHMFEHLNQTLATKQCVGPDDNIFHEPNLGIWTHAACLLTGCTIEGRDHLVQPVRVGSDSPSLLPNAERLRVPVHRQLRKAGLLRGNRLVFSATTKRNCRGMLI